MGPALNYFFTDVNFTICGLLVDRYTAPGFLMVIGWTVDQLLVIFTYFDPDEIGMEEDEKQEEIPLKNGDELNPHQNVKTAEESLHSPASSNSIAELFQLYYREFIVDNIVVCFSMFFLILFVLSNLETAATPLMVEFFHYDTFQSSLFFGILGLVGFVSIVTVGILGKKNIDDRYVALTGLILVSLTSVGRIVLLPNGAYGQKNLLAYFYTLFIIYVVGHAILVISTISLYSKLVSNECMGFAMGLKRGIDIVAMMLGTLWSGALVNDLYLLFGVNLGLGVFVLVLFVSSFKTMVRS